MEYRILKSVVFAVKGLVGHINENWYIAVNNMEKEWITIAASAWGFQDSCLIFKEIIINRQ